MGKAKKPKRKRKSTKKLVPRARRMQIPTTIMPVTIPTSSLHRNSCVGAYLDFKQGKLLGQGLTGFVYELCDEKKNCPYVLKVREMNGANNWRVNEFYSRFMNEVNFQKRAHVFGLAPKIYDAWSCVELPRVSTFIVMERMDGDLEHYLRTHIVSESDIPMIVKRIQDLVNELRQIGICHGDLQNPGNILYKGDRWYIGDYESASVLSRTCDDEEIATRWYYDIIRVYNNMIRSLLKT